jgi:hypothetical protein
MYTFKFEEEQSNPEALEVKTKVGNKMAPRGIPSYFMMMDDQ